jgi:N-acetylneuraminic acid mutarotase
MILTTMTKSMIIFVFITIAIVQCHVDVKGHWEMVPKHGTPPSGRQKYCSAISSSNHYFMVFGGSDGQKDLNDMWMFNFTSTSWSRIITSGLAPSPRSGCVASIHEDLFYIFGGYNDASGVVCI